jgi:hydrazine synthase alpha subunit-like protein/concanavalin A-like lectin/glucanase superfamily protein/WD40 repeat protein
MSHIIKSNFNYWFGFGIILGIIASAAAEQTTPQNLVQQRYWWLDEIRTVAHELSRVRTGKVSEWPQISIPAGLGVLPAPRNSGPIKIDGQLIETTWKKASRFPVGPIFPDFQEGPFTLWISAVCDNTNVYLAIESPCDLSHLGTITRPGVMFEINGKTYNITTSTGKIHEAAIHNTSSGQGIELALPLPKGRISLSFFPEVLRQPKGQSPPDLKYLGLDRHKKAVWLNPININLIPADAAIRFSSDKYFRPTRLTYQIHQKQKPEQKKEVSLRTGKDGTISYYHWQQKVQGKDFHLEGFFYQEPIRETLQTAREMAQRLMDMDLAEPDVRAYRKLIAQLETKLRPDSASSDNSQRELYCQARRLRARIHRSMLDSPLLFVKRHPYYAGHIYDDYLTWRPGGGIYVIENPSATPADQKIHTIIDPTSPETLGQGVYRDPDLNWDGKQLVFAHKGENNGSTSLYEIGIDGRGLKQLTDPEHQCTTKPPVRALGAGRHDITPTYLPDDRIVFTSTRPAGRVPCFNSEVDVLHIMNGNGSDIRCLSINNVNEFDPAVLPDGRILYGRWEYVDKTALYMQSLWTMLPDGTGETALFANNTAKPTAVLDARPVPGTHLIAASLTPHNGQAVGAIAVIDPHKGKNSLDAIVNFTPEYPIRMDQGLRDGPSDPWPLSKHDILFSNNAIGGHGIIELADRYGHRECIHAEQDISCYAPMPIKPRPRPRVIPDAIRERNSGDFLVSDIYHGLKNVQRGDIKQLRIVEETTRTSGIPGGGRWWNQAFLISWQGAYVVKNILGVVPVHEDGSAYFEVPAGRAVYFQALDEKGREIQRMRTFVQASPGVTRSCIGCHENKMIAPPNGKRPLAQKHPPARPQPESWGSGFIDYATMVQPILDQHCVQCHGGKNGIAGGIDLTGGWTWAFNISYETLIKNNLVGFIRCHNSDTTSSDILSPRTIGSGAAKLTELLNSGHKDRIPKLSKQERDLFLAWMDTNSNYYGTWNWTEYATCDSILKAGSELKQVMTQAGCNECHSGAIGNDWVNLKSPKYSRILRAPLKKTEGGTGLGWCRKRKAQTGRLPLVTQRNLPPDVFRPPTWPKRDPAGEVNTPFESTENPHYQAMLKIIQQARRQALTRARVDMPDAHINPGLCRQFYPSPTPEIAPHLSAQTDAEGIVRLSWNRSAEAIGLNFDLYRGRMPYFKPQQENLVHSTTMFQFTDYQAPTGPQYYALMAGSKDQYSKPVYAMVEVPFQKPPSPPTSLNATPKPGEVKLNWSAADDSETRFNIYRAESNTNSFRKLNPVPIMATEYLDTGLVSGKKYRYIIRTLNRRNRESQNSLEVIAAALPERKEPVFSTSFTQGLNAVYMDNQKLTGKKFGQAASKNQSLDVSQGGHVIYPNQPEFALTSRLSVECWINLQKTDQMPVLISCGQWRDKGWFLQKLGGVWRWHIGGVDCDGGKVPAQQWIHLAGIFDGNHAHLYQNGKKVASIPCHPNRTPWPGPLFVGQYGPGPGTQYQVFGKIDDIKIYRRALTRKEIEKKFTTGRSKDH